MREGGRERERFFDDAEKTRLTKNSDTSLSHFRGPACSIL